MSLIQNLFTKKKDFSAIHLTDIHLGNSGNYATELPKFITKVTSNHYASLKLNTGDTFSDNLGTNAEWNDLKTQLGGTMISCLGNHDYTRTAAELGMPSDYYSQDYGTKWRFISLCNMGARTIGTPPSTYEIDAVQLQWLKDTLAASAGKFICLMMHVPMLNTIDVVWKALKPGGSTTNLLNTNATTKELITLFRQYKNIKVVLSGHAHITDECVNEGVIHLNTAAVCGGWWNTHPSSGIDSWLGYVRGYRIIDFYKDGTIRHELVNY